MHHSTDPDYLQDHLIVTSCYTDSEGIEIRYTLAGAPGRMKLGPREASKVLCDLNIIEGREVLEGAVWLEVLQSDEWGVFKPVWKRFDHWAREAFFLPVEAKEIALRHLEDEELKHALWMVYTHEQKRPELN